VASGQRNLFAVMGVASLASLIAFVQLYPSQQALVAVGPISYSLSLWHWGVPSLSRWTTGMHWWSLHGDVLGRPGAARRAPGGAQWPALRAGGQLPSGQRRAAVDLFDLFCPERSCTYRSADRQILYRDEHSHPSKQAVRLAMTTAHG
jgi:hypothetical protein